MNYNRSSFGIGGGALTPAIKNLLFANGIVFLMQILNPSLGQTILNYFALVSNHVLYQFRIYELVTYMFLHGGFWHIAVNMFMLWMFGTELEREWGTKQFLKYYFLCGIGAGLFNIFLTPAVAGHIPTVGASGAVYGIMIAFALKNPNREMLVIPIPFPVKVKYFIGFLVIFTLISTANPLSGGIAHAAHLGGIVVGFVYLKYWSHFYKLKSWFQQGQKKSNQNMKYNQGGDQKVEYYRKKIDEILDKINRVGYLNLTDEEKELLEEGSKYLREHEKSDFN